MRFQLPQFIDVEDKIFGPLTFKQFIYIGGGASLSYVIYEALPLFIAIFAIIPVIMLSLALAFYRINNKPFVEILESGFRYFLSRRLYIWRKVEKPLHKAGIKKGGEERTDAGVFIPRLSESKLKDIAWSLDVEESIYAGQEDERRMRAMNAKTPRSLG